MTAHEASLANGTSSSNGNLTGSPNGDNVPFPLRTAEHSCSVMGAILYQRQVVLGGSG